MSRLRLPLCLALFAALALVPAAAFAAPPTHEQFRDVGTDVDPDFCGTGQAIDVSFDVRGDVWTTPEEPNLVEMTISGKVVFTNPTTGASVTFSFAGRFIDEIISGDPEGLHTHLYTNIGLALKLQTTNGPVLLRDAGILVLRSTFGPDEEFIGADILVVKGPHPAAESDVDLFCEVATEALGIA